MQPFFQFEIAMLIVVAIIALLLGRYASVIMPWFSTKRWSFGDDILNSIPALLWIEHNGKIDWSNAAYQKLEKRLKKPIHITDFNLSEPFPNDGRQCRSTLSCKDSEIILNFDISQHLFGNKHLYVAISAKAAVKAEQDRIRFVQTLSETFAHLPIGMAVFDKERDLSLFNPALSELLDVSTIWLTQKPSLRDFLDRLHDKGALPEPRNFRSWRDQIVDMEKSAESGTYFDDWHMPNDKVFRVTGRPHPKGAVAFIFEDISRPVATEREYRLEIERLYAAVDALGTGIIIFDATGSVSFANHAFDSIWKTEFSKSLMPPTAMDILEAWHKKCKPSPVLSEIKDFILSIGERAPWTDKIILLSGVPLEVRATPMSAGHTMIEFLYIELENKHPEILEQSA